MQSQPLALVALIVAKPKITVRIEPTFCIGLGSEAGLIKKKTSTHGLFLNKETEFNEYRK